MLIFFILGNCAALYCTAIAEVGYFQSRIDQKNLSPHNFLESSPLVEQCMADSIRS